MRLSLAAFGLLGAAAACGGRGSGSPTCGIAGFVGPSQLLGEFTVPRQTLAVAPRSLPPRLVARIAGGGAYSAIVGRQPEHDSLLVVGVNGALPSGPQPGFAVLVLDLGGSARGIVLYQGPPIGGAPELGVVNMGRAAVPLIGVQADPRRFEDPKCPFFPDSILR